MMGCTTSDGPTVLLIDPSNYAFAFDAAVEAAAADGMKPVLLDRRNGIIVTSPTVAGSLIEPWKSRASSPSMVNTTRSRKSTREPQSASCGSEGRAPASAATSLGKRVRMRNDPSNSDRKSTRLNSSHDQIPYAVFCLQKKKKKTKDDNKHKTFQQS